MCTVSRRLSSARCSLPRHAADGYGLPDLLLDAAGAHPIRSTSMGSPRMPDRPVPDLAALSDLGTPWCIHVVATLRIADQIAAGANEIDALAAQAGCDATMLQSVLRHLVRKGVFEEPAPGQFALNEAARWLLDPGLRLVLDLDGLGGRFAHAWGTLLSAVRTGAPAYQERFGLPFWEDLD